MISRLLKAVVIIASLSTFSLPDRAAAAEAYWVKELRRLGFSGYPIIIRNDDEWKNARLSPTVFVVEAMPQTMIPSQIFTALTPDWLDLIRKELAAGDFVLTMVLALDEESPRAGVSHAQNDKWKALRRRGRNDKQVLVWSSSARLDTLAHEAQHLSDNRLAIHAHIQDLLIALGFNSDDHETLAVLIRELRAYSAQLLHENVELQNVADGTAYYLAEALDVLAKYPYTQSLRYATLVRSYLIDVPQSDLSDYVVKKLEAPPCERSLSSSSENK